MEDAHFPCAAPCPLSGHGTYTRLVEDLASRPRSAPSLRPSLPRRGRKKERAPALVLSSPDQFASSTRRGVPRREPPAGLRRRVQAAGAISMAEPGPPAGPARATGGGASPPTALQSPKGGLLPRYPWCARLIIFMCGRDEEWSIFYCHNNTSNSFPTVPPRDTYLSQQLKPNACPMLLL